MNKQQLKSIFTGKGNIIDSVDFGITANFLQILPPQEASTDWNLLATFNDKDELIVISWTQGVADGA